MSKKRRQKIGRVNIEICNGHYRLRWTFEGQRKSLTICPISTQDAFNLAESKAKEIDVDITKTELGLSIAYDRTLAKYSKKVGDRLKKDDESHWNLKAVWDDYKLRNTHISPSTQIKIWRSVDNLLAFGVRYHGQEDCRDFVDRLLSRYSRGGLERPISCLASATNQWSKRNKTNNPWQDIKTYLPKREKVDSNRSKQAWSQREIHIILNRFEDSFYHPYVCFLAYTGCRPEEAIALHWKDVSDEYIIFSRSFTHGALRETTKNGKSRRFPINAQLDKLLGDHKHNKRHKNDIVFPSAKGVFLNQKNFNSRHFKPIVKELCEASLISKNLPTYNLRNSWITLMLKRGLDIASVAKLAGTSEKMILSHYWSADDSIIIPEV